MSNEKYKINQKENQITFRLATNIYCPKAIRNAAYVFIDKAYVEIGGDEQEELVVTLTSKEKIGREQLFILKGEFYNELLNYLIRTEVSQANQKIREYIIATALVSGLPRNLLPSNDGLDGKDEDWKNDPLSIAIPWEKKNKKNKKKIE
jgi:His-Xaa-Ser system protein HxsD